MNPIAVFRSVTNDGRISRHLKNAQVRELITHNTNRQDREFHVGEKVLVKIKKRLGNKLTNFLY